MCQVRYIIFPNIFQRFGFNLVDAINEIAKRTQAYKSQKNKILDEPISPGFASIHRVRHDVRLSAILKTLSLSLGEKGQKFITFRMANTNIQFGMVCLVMS